MGWNNGEFFLFKFGLSKTKGCYPRSTKGQGMVIDYRLGLTIEVKVEIMKA